ncbi:hypothetical protein EYF80_050999 [Liparis tanakae]|uniref:Uncharacterized protein n=1 Tax=Liparis tanakae TaxID=230148 RepID=A0A4Z2FCC7_9TELE|nr:hypothetical protein EYF80_050999 [Liparis tanakae]
MRSVPLHESKGTALQSPAGPSAIEVRVPGATSRGRRCCFTTAGFRQVGDKHAARCPARAHTFNPGISRNKKKTLFTPRDATRAPNDPEPLRGLQLDPHGTLTTSTRLEGGGVPVEGPRGGPPWRAPVEGTRGGAPWRGPVERPRGGAPWRPPAARPGSRLQAVTAAAPLSLPLPLLPLLLPLPPLSAQAFLFLLLPLVFGSLLSFFQRMRRFWNHTFTCRSDRQSACATSTRRRRVR